MPALIPFGYRLSDRQIVDPLMVERGRACGCVCMACDGQLEVRKGPKIRPYFAHMSDADCRLGYETALHFAAKQVIQRLGYLWLPEIATAKESPGYFKQTVVKVEMEKSVGEIRPDLIVSVGASQLAVEVRVTHKVSEDKVSKYRRKNLSCVEYDLSDFERGTTFLALEEKFKAQGIEADWIYNRRYSLKPICIGGLMIAPAECEMLVEGSTIRVRTGNDAFDQTIVFLSPAHARSALPRVQAGEFFYVADDAYRNGLPVTGGMSSEKVAMRQIGLVRVTQPSRRRLW